MFLFMFQSCFLLFLSCLSFYVFICLSLTRSAFSPPASVTLISLSFFCVPFLDVPLCPTFVSLSSQNPACFSSFFYPLAICFRHHWIYTFIITKNICGLSQNIPGRQFSFVVWIFGFQCRSCDFEMCGCKGATFFEFYIKEWLIGPAALYWIFIGLIGFIELHVFSTHLLMGRPSELPNHSQV